MTPPGKRILIAIHWYQESLHEGALRRCNELGWEAVVLNGDSLATIAGTPCDGILGMLPPPGHAVHRFAAESSVPVVELSASYPENKHWGRYPSDGIAVGSLAAEHLRRRPVAAFLFLATGASPAHDIRRAGFIRGLAGDARPVHTFDPGGTDLEATGRLADFLKKLPRPIGIFGSVDASARQALNAAHNAGLRVPEDAYILGFGNRRLVSAMASTPISSIALDHEAWGYAAVGLLEDMIAGRAAPGTTRTFAPGGVVERASTGGDNGAGNPLCARAIALMNENLAHPLEVNALAARLGVSKATLDRAFSAAYGMGVASRYVALRLETAKGLLTSGEKAESVAAAVGFASYRAFGKAFGRATGRTPSSFSPRHARSETE